VQSLRVPEPNDPLEGNPYVVDVTRRDQSIVTIYQPTVRGDSLLGWLENPVPDASSTQRAAVSLADVRAISVRRFDRTGTAVLLLGSVMVVAVYLLALLFITISHEGS
jgi:hypothetical protein